jgi:NADPH2:quinone reductase
VRAVIYTTFGDPNVLQIVERDVPLPEPHEVLVQLHRSGVNPTDWKSRQGSSDKPAFAEIIPNQDGAGVITAVGSSIDTGRVGERVWIYEAQHGRAYGTAAEYIAIDAGHTVTLPDTASFDLGASLGVPAITAHRCLTVGVNGPRRLTPGSMIDQTVLVAGGAGAVGHAAIELAGYAGAKTITTVSSPVKAELARRAGADVVINYNDDDAAQQIRSVAPDGVDLIVEVSSVTNLALNEKVLKEGGTISIYASGPDPLTLEIRTMMRLNARLQFVYLYLVPLDAKATGIEDITAALREGVLRVGDAFGMPLGHFSLEETKRAHQAVEDHFVGKVLIDIVSANEG